MTVRCDDCEALHWAGENQDSRVGSQKFEACCKRGDLVLHPFRQPPTLLQDLLAAQNPRSRHFRDNIRRYNSAFAFTSIECETTDRGMHGGPNCFQIHGALYHTTGPLDPAPGQQPRYAQLYFHDPQTAAAIRHSLNDGLDHQIISQITEMLHEIRNPYIGLYKTAWERLRQSFGNPIRILLNPQMRLIIETGADRRRENLPTANEVAAIIPDESDQAGEREVVIAKRNLDGRNNSFHHVPCTHGAYMPLAYPLIFPYGDVGFHWGLRLRDSRQQGRIKEAVSLRMYYRYVLHPRKGNSLIPFAFRRLFQQYVVDAWAICDQTKLSWLRQHQNNLRADLYQGVADALSHGDTDPAHIGRRIILPSSYLGSDRFISQCYQNSMAIVRRFGHPTYFITFTANPNWPEITAELLPGQTTLDRPDLVSRVFRLKCKELLFDLRHREVFGKFRGNVWTIEYQKRGLPHMHLLLFLHPEDRDRLLDPAVIDRVIRAEFPLPEDDPDGILTEVVQTCMIHGPCGADFSTAPCMVNADNGKACSKRFPKDFNPETIVKEDGYPLYRRRDNGAFFTKTIHGQTVTFDNRHIVPYNPYLSRKFQAHINVEICASVGAIKYIHKYIYKGTDRSTIRISGFSTSQGEAEHDEITRHLQGRYIGPSEAVWQLFEFPVHEEYPPVIPLAVHLPGKEPVYFDGDASPEEILNRMENQLTTLTAFFRYNAEHPEDRNWLYHEFPEHCVFNNSTRRWTLRKRGFAIGRMYYVTPMAGERYYLRLLLTAVRGPTSFEDLRTVHGVLYPTFQAACIALGLLQNDQSWVSCFEEAVTFSHGRQLRMLFATALTFGEISNPVELWSRFCTHFCDDLPYALRHMVHVPIDLDVPHVDYGLYLLSQLLTDHGKTLDDYGLPSPIHDWGHFENPPLEYYNPVEQSQLANEIIRQFNTDQAACFEAITSTIDNNPASAHFFVQGPAGTGKTFLYRGLCHYYRGKGQIVLCVASSGIASLLLPGGTTAHSRFKIPLDISEQSTCGVSKSSDLANLLQRTSLIIWDEVPMQHKYCFEAVHRMLTDIRDDDSLFGGIATVFGGDFAQILPVIRRGTRADIVAASLRNSFLWANFQILHLQENMRVIDTEQNRRFAEWIRKLPYDSTFHGKIELFPGITQFRCPKDFCSHIYPPNVLETAHNDLSSFRIRAILSVRNESVASINGVVVDKMPGTIYEYFSVDTIDEEVSEPPPVELLQSFNPSSLPPSRLRLKVGAPIILLRNLSPKQGLCNGTRLQITRLTRNCIEARILGGDFDGELRLIPRVKLTSLQGELPYVIVRIQFPVCLCFAMTINRSQGQSFKVVGVDLRHSVFSHGQFYVAMSRVTDVNNLSVLLPVKGDGRVENIVFPEVLLYPGH
jgi:hypothetical protein